MQKIRVGIIGAGKNTRTKHIPGLQALKDVEIVGVCNRSKESSQRVADEFGISRIYGSWQEAINDPDTNAIVTGTWPYMHQRLTLAALAAEKHVMCEARMARNLAEAEEMLAVSQAMPHLITQIVPSPMSFGVDATIQRLISEGFLGDILAIEGQLGGSDFIDLDGPLSWRQSFDYSGYNIMGLGIWYETLMRWVGEATHVMAMGKVAVSMRLDEDSGQLKPVRVPDHLNVTAKMACDAQMNLTFSRLTGLQKESGVYLFGSEGTLYYSGGTLYGGQRGDERLSPIDIPAEEAGAWRVEEEFVNAIRGQESIRFTDFETGVKYMRFVEAVSLSIAERSIVTL